VRPMSKWESVLTSAFDGSSYGIVLLDEDFEARFINRAYYGMWSLPAPPPGKTYNVTDLIAHARSTGAYDTSGEEMDDYVRGCLALICDGPQPPMHLRLSNGRILNFESQIQPAGGRMLTFDDITDLVQTADRLRVFATIDDLTKLLNRRQFLDSLKSEFSRSQRHSCLLSVSTRVELSGGELAVASLAVPSSSKRGFRRVDGKISEFLIERKSAMDSFRNVSQP
jgi:PAS fold